MNHSATSLTSMKSLICSPCVSGKSSPFIAALRNEGHRLPSYCPTPKALKIRRYASSMPSERAKDVERTDAAAFDAAYE